MKIYFCDVCNESIPLKDINSNRITIEDGKIICPKCAPKKASRREPLPGPLLVLVGVTFIGMVVLAVSGGLRAGKLEEDLGQVQDQAAGLARSLRSAESRQLTMARKLTDLEGRLARLDKTMLREIGELQARTRALLKQTSDNKSAAASGLASTRKELLAALEKSGRSANDRLTRLDQRVTALRVQQESVSQNIDKRMDDIKDLVRGAVPALAVSPAAKVKHEEGAPGSAEDKEITQLIAQLANPNAGDRFGATADLGNYSGPRVVAALEKMLEDPTEFVRKMAILGLKKLKSLGSAPLIIEALRDEDLYVRVASNDALKTISGQDFGFDPEASPSRREVKVKQWEKWWRDNKARLLRSK